MSRDEYFDRWSRTHGNYNPSNGSRFVRGWLVGTYAFSKPLVALRVPPDVITILGGLLSGCVALIAWAGDRWLIAAGVLCALSGILDSLDGAVAVMSDRATNYGYVLDSLVDRISDCLYVLALWLAGADDWLCIALLILTMLHEYIRARAVAAGMAEVGVVTVAERPTRVIVTALALLVAGIDPTHSWAQFGAFVWIVLATIGLLQLVIVVFTRLRKLGPTDHVGDDRR
jgi:phosphatidylglycerophosphate synthase